MLLPDLQKALQNDLAGTDLFVAEHEGTIRFGTGSDDFNAMDVVFCARSHTEAAAFAEGIRQGFARGMDAPKHWRLKNRERLLQSVATELEQFRIPKAPRINSLEVLIRGDNYLELGSAGFDGAPIASCDVAYVLDAIANDTNSDAEGNDWSDATTVEIRAM